MTWLDRLAAYLMAEGLVRGPTVAAAKPLPPVWRHPDEGPIGPGDAKDAGRDPATWDDGLVVSLMRAPDLGLFPGDEDRSQRGVDIVLRGRSVPAIDAIELDIRRRLLGHPPYPGGPLDPGGRADWIMDGLHVIQSRPWRPYQPLDATAGVYTFSTGWIFDVRA